MAVADAAAWTGAMGRVNSRTVKPSFARTTPPASAFGTPGEKNEDTLKKIFCK